MRTCFVLGAAPCLEEDLKQEKKNIAIVSNMQWKIKILTNKNTIH